MSSLPGPARRTSRLTRMYVAGWGILAAVALAYLVVLAIRPDFGAGSVTRITPAQPEPTQVQRTISKALAELQSVRQSVAEAWTQIGALKDAVSRQEDQSRTVAALSHEVADLRSTVAGQDERGRTLAARLAAVESRQLGAEGPSQARVSQPAAASSRNQAAELAAPTVTGSVDERPGRANAGEAKVASAQRPHHDDRPKQAGAAAMPLGGDKVAAAAPKAPAIKGPVGLQLATGQSADALRLAWLRVITTQKEALQGLEPRYAEVKIATGVIYRLIAGPVDSSELAARICADLKAKKVSCAVASYTGQPL